MSETRKPLYYGWIMLAAVVFVMLAGSGIRAVFGVFIKPIEAEFGWSRAQLSGAAALSLFVLGGVGHEVGQHEAVGRVAAHEEGEGEEPECRHPHGFRHGHATLVLHPAERRPGGGARPVRLQTLVGRIVTHEGQDEGQGQYQDADAEPEKGRPPAVEPDDHHGHRDYEHLAG